MDESAVKGRARAWVRVSNIRNSEMASQAEVVNAFFRRNAERLDRGPDYLDPDRPRWAAIDSAVLDAAIRDGGDGHYDWLVLDKQQRLGTYDVMQYYAILNRFRAGGVRVWSCEEGELTTTDVGSSFQAVAKSHSEVAEQRNKAGNVVRGMLLRAKQGHYTGAILPFAYDRICVGPEGVERFRLVELDRTPNPLHVRGSKERANRRWINRYRVIYPGGHEDILEDPPGKAKLDHYEFAVSILAERAEAVREMFRLFLDGWTCAEIAREMNRRGGSLGFRSQWLDFSVRGILANPLYGGVYEWKKQTVARYKTIDKEHRYIDVAYNPSVKAPGPRKIAPEDRVRAALDERLRIVDEATIAAAREKLAGAAAPARKPRSEALWLRPFLVCGDCGGGFAGQNRRDYGGKPERIFLCSTYLARLAKGRGPECRSNLLKSSDLEAALTGYLERLGEGVRFDLAHKDPRVGPLLLPLGDRIGAWDAIAREMEAFVRARMPDASQKLLGVEGGISLVDAYRHYWQRQADERGGEAESIAEEIGRLARALPKVEGNPLAEAALKADMAALAERHRAAEARGVALDRRLDRIAAELEEIEGAIRSVHKSAAERRYRKAGDDLGRVLGRIVVEGADYGSARLAAAVRFEPRIGEAERVGLAPPPKRPDRAAMERAEGLARDGVNPTAVAKILDAEGFEPVGSRWHAETIRKRFAAIYAELGPEKVRRGTRSRKAWEAPGA